MPLLKNFFNILFAYLHINTSLELSKNGMQHIFEWIRDTRQKIVTFIKDFMLKRFSSIILYLSVFILWKVEVWHAKYLHISLHFLHILHDFTRVLAKFTLIIWHEFSHSSFHLMSCRRSRHKSALIYLTGVVCITDSVNVSVIPQSINQSKIFPFNYSSIHSMECFCTEAEASNNEWS